MHSHSVFGSAITAAVLLLGLLTTAVADTLTVILPRAVVRVGPSTSHDVLVTVSKDMAFPILTTDKGWHKIPLEDGREGWIADTGVRVARDSRGFAVVTPPPVPAAAPVSEQVVGRRMALVIGNAAYDIGPLKNPVNDATDMAAALQRLGFTVTRLLNANQAVMESTMEAFGQQLRQGGVGLFYFAGHGLQVGGENYLMPIGARISREQDVKIAAVHVGRILGAMEDAKNDLNIVILDACRNNPFARGFRSQVQGLAPVDAARGSLIAYATAPGSVASDGGGRNGPYTENLLRYMMTPGLSVEQMFKQVRIGVVQTTSGQQTPWEASSLTGDFSFVPSGTQSAPQVVASPPATPPLPVPKLVGKQEQATLKQPSLPPPASPEQRQGARIMVILLETSQGRRLNDPAGEKAMIRQLMQSGFSVVDQEQVQRIRESDQLRKAVTGDREAARSLGQRHGADVLIVGEASSEKAMSGGPLGQLVSVRAYVDARALRTDTGDILTTDGQSASGVDLVESSAGKKALEAAAKKWVETNLPRLRQR
ncbi:MAG: hypothetical protein EXR78_09355 [Deltaproteobacteria bacterium]|nr:hypothetical protein [Deltaproteobacteria bacterium]